MIIEKEKLSGHPMFYEILEEMKQIHAVKNKDYGGGDPLGNFKTSADSLGISPFKGILVRLSDKWSRISNIVKSGETHVKDETIEDTLKDLACYSILAIIVRRETEIKQPNAVKQDRSVPHEPQEEADRLWFKEIQNGVSKGSRNETARKLFLYLQKRQPGNYMLQKATLDAWNNLNHPPLKADELQAIFDSTKEK
jgi:hypothetical protein